MKGLSYGISDQLAMAMLMHWKGKLLIFKQLRYRDIKAYFAMDKDYIICIELTQRIIWQSKIPSDIRKYLNFEKYTNKISRPMN